MSRRTLALAAVVLALATACGGGSVVVTPSAPLSPPASPGPASCSPSTSLVLSADGLDYDLHCLSVPAGAPAALAFANNDAGEVHNVAVYRWDSCLAKAARAGTYGACPDPNAGRLFVGAVIGYGHTTYHMPAFTPGRYTFLCSVHPFMRGVLRVR